MECVAISDDSKYVPSGSYDNNAHIWDVQRGCSVGNPLPGHSRSVRSVAFSRNEEYLVSCSRDEKLRLWNVRSGRLVGQPFIGHNSSVHSVSCCLEDRRIMSSSDDKTMRILDMKFGQQIGMPIKFEDSVEHVSVSNDNRTAVSGFHNGSVSIWDMLRRTVFQKCSVDAKGLRNSHVSVCFAKNVLACAGGQKIFIYSMDEQITTMRQPLLYDNLTAVSIVTSTDHSIVALYVPKFESIYIWHVKEQTANVTVKPVSPQFKYNGFHLSKEGSLLLECDGNWVHAWPISAVWIASGSH